jgi:hypothetical protein
LTLLVASAGWGKTSLLADWHTAGGAGTGRLAGVGPRGQRPGSVLDLPDPAVRIGLL